MHANHLSLQQAVKDYKQLRAVDSVDLDVKKGEFLTILGPSGSGKTSLLKLIAGFEELSSGAIQLNGQDITKKKPYERNIGMLFQNYALFPHMTVAQNVGYSLKIRKVGKQEIAEKVSKILDLVHMGEYAHRLPTSLSGGQQQRVALARAIVFSPPLLLLDEPLGALDKNLRERMQLEIKHIQEQVGITTISVTHDQEEALTMSDRICVMNKGKIEQIASPEEIYLYPKNRFVAEFIGEINLFQGEVASMEKTKAVIKLQGADGHVFYSSTRGCQHGQAIYLAIRPENIRLIQEKHQADNSLEVTVTEKIYIGDAIKMKTLTSFNEEVMVRIPFDVSKNVQLGEKILLGWDSEHSTSIPFEASAT